MFKKYNQNHREKGCTFHHIYTLITSLQTQFNRVKEYVCTVAALQTKKAMKLKLDDQS